MSVDQSQPRRERVSSDGEGDRRSKYERYVEEAIEDITETIQHLGCQPILFIGSGLSKRYFDAPSWDELLSILADQCGDIDKGLGFYKQSLQTPQRIGEAFAEIYHSWAWGTGRNEFPPEMFHDNVNAGDYLKYKIASHFRHITPTDIDHLLEGPYGAEIKSLIAIKPHAIVTTNYDSMIETLFPDHESVIGQQILKGNQVLVGEIFKIHGCITKPESLVFTESDYLAFQRKKKFLSAKLLTFFNEHPLIFIGYSASDPNIRAILADIDEALPEKGGMIPNVYILQWNKDINDDSTPAREKVIPTEDDRTVRVKLIEANDFSWVFDTFSANPALNDVNPRLLRALIARSYSLVRHDIPKMKVQADFKMLERAVEDSRAFAKLFGIANISDYSAASIQHPYSATELGQRLGGKKWHITNDLINKIAKDTGVNIKKSDNKYHRAEKLNNSTFHKYSEDAFVLLKTVKGGQTYKVDLG
jgi:hypothetical protein